MSDQISYKIGKKNLIVYTDKDTHKSFLKYLNGSWSDEHNAWLLSKNKEKELKKFIGETKLQTISSDVKSRKLQDRYKREVSESESDSSTDLDSGCDSSSVSDSDVKTNKVSKSIEKEMLEKRKIEEKNKFEEEKLKFSKKSIEKTNKLKTKYTSDDPLLYYKSFNSQPKNFKKVNNYQSSEGSLSVESSSCSSSSDDSFPSPKTPKKRRNYNKGINNDNYDDILGEMKSLSRRVIELEIENKKLKSKNK
jgi:hypothetical protein